MPLPNLKDLTTTVHAYIFTTLTGTKQTVDVTTLYTKDIPTVNAGTVNRTDVDTRLKEYLGW
jgi:hypothetical protein